MLVFLLVMVFAGLFISAGHYGLAFCLVFFLLIAMTNDR